MSTMACHAEHPCGCRPATLPQSSEDVLYDELRQYVDEGLDRRLRQYIDGLRSDTLVSIKEGAVNERVANELEKLLKS
jgi:hypothetical protein